MSYGLGGQRGLGTVFAGNSPYLHHCLQAFERLEKQQEKGLIQGDRTRNSKVKLGEGYCKLKNTKVLIAEVNLLLKNSKGIKYGKARICIFNLRVNRALKTHS